MISIIRTVIILGKFEWPNKAPTSSIFFGVPILISNDGGKNWASINAANVHSDHHACGSTQKGTNT
ncbi:MAG: hypothetical protein R2788_19690 [Saprospiraceae bacterium]